MAPETLMPKVGDILEDWSGRRWMVQWVASIEEIEKDPEDWECRLVSVDGLPGILHHHGFFWRWLRVTTH